MDELAMDELGMDELAMDELGMEKLPCMEVPCSPTGNHGPSPQLWCTTHTHDTMR